MPVISRVRLCAGMTIARWSVNAIQLPRVRVPLRDEKWFSRGAALVAQHRDICQASRFQRPEYSCTS